MIRLVSDAQRRRQRPKDCMCLDCQDYERLVRLEQLVNGLSHALYGGQNGGSR